MTQKYWSPILGWLHAKTTNLVDLPVYISVAFTSGMDCRDANKKGFQEYRVYRCQFLGCFQDHEDSRGRLAQDSRTRWGICSFSELAGPLTFAVFESWIGVVLRDIVLAPGVSPRTRVSWCPHCPLATKPFIVAIPKALRLGKELNHKTMQNQSSPCIVAVPKTLGFWQKWLNHKRMANHPEARTHPGTLGIS